uniref:tRNA threonylcarbamoyladenosine biosynthesis protein TsaE n=1 Tax=Candidatus Kentrum sp. MB TaxID=2138164 RepID=A0A450XUE8_9GAMM|nr:MAG: tRNA threonylcarbamoyladenosine biosynthesis protein TsaE [Candidatus Kentron sp. MB]VFK32930.1 MAG: tRNA threonylcarbamoyladenosine biosynthesis protein TsaE [Candidatus Kentron sp. MB]
MADMQNTIFAPDAHAMEKLGKHIAKAREKGGVIYLQGELGAGKTTLARGIIHALGITGPVKSPTYTLLESYETPTIPIYHLDLYRLQDPEELEYIGIRDYLDENALFLIEWPEHGKEGIPVADLIISIQVLTAGRLVTASSPCFSSKPTQVCRQAS